jgi:DNA-binding NtrC family response regulator
MSPRIILIDHDHSTREQLTDKLRSLGYGELTTADNAHQACDVLADEPPFDLALIEMNMPDMDGVAMLDHVKKTCPETECIMVTTINDARVSKDCLKKGAYDYLIKPVTKEVLALTLPKALERKRLLDILDVKKRQECPELVHPEPFSPIITRSPLMRRLLKEAELHAASDLPILITGESGTGKELLAWTIHQASPRSAFPFTPINMASISSSLFEAEFFKPRSEHSDSTSRILEHTDKGTLFLNEIGELPLVLQGKLLSLMQEGAFSRVGSNDRVVVDLKIIAASNENLDAMLARNAIRKDLYYRISSGWLHLPALRERREDIPLLARAFLDQLAPPDHPGVSVSQDVLNCLMKYSWPGNIRELKSVLRLVAGVAQDHPVEVDHLPQTVRDRRTRDSNGVHETGEPEILGIQTLADIQKAHIIKIYAQLGGNKVRTAQALGIGLNTLRRKLKMYGMK